jgi:hypothetical protein
MSAASTLIYLNARLEPTQLKHITVPHTEGKPSSLLLYGIIYGHEILQAFVICYEILAAKIGGRRNALHN